MWKDMRGGAEGMADGNGDIRATSPTHLTVVCNESSHGKRFATTISTHNLHVHVIFMAQL